VQRRPLADDLGVGRGSATSSAVAPAKWSAVTLRMQLPEVWMACISTLGELGQDVGDVESLGQLNCRFWRVVKWPVPRS
jgi:hypothetical protein